MVGEFIAISCSLALIIPMALRKLMGKSCMSAPHIAMLILREIVESVCSKVPVPPSKRLSTWINEVAVNQQIIMLGAKRNLFIA
jgi:hypothetical protein